MTAGKADPAGIQCLTSTVGERWGSGFLSTIKMHLKDEEEGNVGPLLGLLLPLNEPCFLETETLTDLDCSLENSKQVAIIMPPASCQ